MWGIGRSDGLSGTSVGLLGFVGGDGSLSCFPGIWAILGDFVAGRHRLWLRSNHRAMVAMVAFRP